MKLERNSYKKNKNNDDSDNSSSLSISTKKKYSQYIKKTLDKEKSIYLIDLDIEKTFPNTHCLLPLPVGCSRLRLVCSGCFGLFLPGFGRLHKRGVLV